MDLSGAQQNAETASRWAMMLGSGTSIWSWLSENSDAITSLAGLVGIFVALAGFFVNWYYKAKSEK